MPISDIINASTRSDLPTPLNPSNDTDITEDIRIWSGNVTLSELKAAYPLTTTNHMFVLDSSIYCASDCRLTFTNVQIDFGVHTCFIHPVALPFIVWKDCLLYTAASRTGGSLTRPPKDANKGRVTLFNKNAHYNADGGGVVGGQTGSGGLDRIHLTLGDMSNVQIRQSANGDNDIQFCRINKGGTYRNVKILRVGSINTNGNVNASDIKLTMHDCEFRSTKESGTRVGAISNASMILNDCIFGNIADTTPTRGTGDNDFMFDQSGSWADAEHHIYFCGTTSDRWHPDWTGQSQNNLMQSHQGGLRYYQVYKEGQVFGGSRHRLFSDYSIEGETDPAVNAVRHSTPTDSHASMVELPTTEHGDTGEFGCLTVGKTRFRHSTLGWQTGIQENHVLKIRERTIQFLDVDINDPTLSIGRPDSPVPIVVQPDRHFNTVFRQATIATAAGRITLDHASKTITLGDSLTWTISALYSYLKILFTDWENFAHEFDISFDGTTLRLPGWTLTIGANNIIYSSNGTRIICETLSAIPSSTSIRAGATIIDSTGITVTVSSTAPDARGYLTYDGQANPRYGALPIQEKIPLNTDVKVTVKAPGYIYQIYEFNTDNQTSLDARMPLDPAIDLGIELSIAEKQTMTASGHADAFFVPLSNANELEIFTSEVNLYSQLGKTKRLIDHTLSVNQAALYFIHHYTDELTGSPLGGQPFLFGIDRMRIDDSKIQFRRTASVNSRCRLGCPVWRASNDMVYFAPIVTNLGSVHFDSLQAVADIPADVLATTVETITTNDTYTGVLSRAMWEYLTTETFQDGSFGKLIKTNLDAKISEAAKDKPPLGYFSIPHIPIAGGGLAAPILEGHGTNVHPHQLFLVSRTARQNGPYYHAETRLYDISGADDGAQFLGGEYISGATQSYTIHAAAISDGYLFLAIQNPGTTQAAIHRIPLDNTDSTKQYETQTISFTPVGLCVNGTDLVLARSMPNEIKLYTLPTTILGAVPAEVVSITDTDHDGQYMGIDIVGTGTEAVIALSTGTRRIHEFAMDYTYVDATELEFNSMGIIWWQETVWTVRRHITDPDTTPPTEEYYMQPLTLDYSAIRQEYIANLVRQNPQKTWNVPFANASSVANSIGSALLSIPQGVWEVSDDNAQSATNSIGSALMDIIVVLDVLTLPGGGLNPTNLNRLSQISGIAASVWEQSILNPTDGSMKKLLRDMLTRLNDQHDTLQALPSSVPSAAEIKTELESTGSDLDRILNLTEKIDGQTAGAGNYGWVSFPTNTYATGYIDHDGILSQILESVNSTNHIIGKRIHTSTGLGVEDHTYHPITLTNKRIVSVADSPTHTFFVVENTDNSTYHIYQQNHSELTEPVSVALPEETKALAAGPQGLYILEVVNSRLQLRWTYNSTSQEFDTQITAGTGTAALAIVNDTAYILHGGSLRAISITDEATDSTIADVNTLLSGSNLIVMHDVLWVYDDGKLYPLDGNHKQINTEWAVSQRQRAENKLDTVTEKTDKITFSGDGSEGSPYRLNAHAAGITAEDLTVDLSPITDAVTEIKNILTTDTVDSVDTIWKKVNAIPTHTLEQISTAIRTLGNYNSDDGGATENLQATFDLLKTDLNFIETALGSELYSDGTSITPLRRIHEIKQILDKIRFAGSVNNYDVKVTLDGEKVTTDDASRTASKATGFATPANVTAARDNVKTALTAAKTSIEGEINANEAKIDTAITNIGTVDGIVDNIKIETDKIQSISTELTADEIDDGTNTNTNRETVKKVIDDIETKVDTTISQTTADAISSAVETAFLDDDDGRAFLAQILQKVEDAIEEESLATNALAIAIRREVWEHVVNPDDPEAAQVNAQTALDNAREQINTVYAAFPAAVAALDWLVKMGRADIVNEPDKVTYYERGSNVEIISFQRRQPIGTIDWSGGWQEPEED